MRISVWLPRSTLETAAALTNCGRAPTTVATLIVVTLLAQLADVLCNVLALGVGNPRVNREGKDLARRALGLGKRSDSWFVDGQVGGNTPAIRYRALEAPRQAHHVPAELARCTGGTRGAC